MYIKIAEGLSDQTRRIHFNLIDDLSIHGEDKDLLIEIPFFTPNEKALEIAQKAPKSFCVHFKTVLSTTTTVVVELEHSKVLLKTAAKMMRKHFDEYFEELRS
jgi:hypothetical protein